ncbi:uncharacterized protein LOC124866100 isoform X2 [Girardinichthys multiradiatus]|uniref:uncharacterized protein LOC124866100 isoform X2 n=1 Tax=Girardinichthys multiradiatus TaxID=208333 RepID=UPI001FAB931D|nr:uncharacterized protein LOC124866100 isoform X2 [Girardinichthys multiradiatus]
MEGPEHVSAESLETRGQVRLLLQRILGSKGDLKSKPQSSCNLLALAPGDFKSKLQSSCNSQPWLQVPALHPAKVKFPSSQGIYLDQVLADSSKPLSSKRTLLTLHQPTIHHQLPRISSVYPRINFCRMKDSPSPPPPSSDSSVHLPAFQSASCPSDSPSNHLPTPCF